MPAFSFGNPWGHHDPHTPLAAQRLNEREQLAAAKFDELDASLQTVGSDSADKGLSLFTIELPFTPVMGDGAADDTAAVNAFLDRHRGERLHVPPTNRTGSATSIKTSDTLFAWKGTKMYAWGSLWKPTSGLANYAVKFGDAAFTPSGSIALTVDAAKGATQVTVSSTAGLSVGDMVRVDDQRTLGGEKLYHEPNYIDALPGAGVVTLRMPLVIAHATADTAAITKISATRGQSIQWEGGVWDMTNVPAKGVSTDPDRGVFAMYYAEDCRIRLVNCINHVYKLFQQQDAVNCHVEECSASAPAADGAGQGYLGSLNGRANTASWCRGFNLRHTVDISGGADNVGSFCFAYGRTPSGGEQTAFYMHGTVTHKCKFTSCFAGNTKVGFGAGNSTFGIDEDFTMTDCIAQSCVEGFYITQACSGWKVSGAAYNCTGRGVIVETSADGELDVLTDGCGTAASGFGSAHFADATVRGKVRVRNALDRSVGITGTCDVDLTVDVDQPSTGPVAGAVVVSSLAATSIVKLRGRIKQNNASNSALGVTDLAGALIDVDMEFSGTGLRAISLAGAGSDRTLRGRIRGTYGEQIRADAGEIIVRDTEFASTGTCIRAATSTTKVTLGRGIVWGGGTRLNNSATATVVGGDVVQDGNAEVQTLATDAIFTLTPATSPRHTIHTGTLTANRAVTLSTTDAHNGERFRITRTGGGAFTLDVGTGPLKSIATNQWAEFAYDGAAWKLSQFGSL